MKQSIAPITASTEVMPGVYLLWLECAEIAAEARPGQFVMVGCGEDTLLRRPLSVHQIDNGKLALLVNVVGKGTRWLSQRRKGDSLDLFGPLGNGFFPDPSSKNLLLVAGGIGVAPLCFLADAAVKQKAKVTLLMGASSAAHLLPEGNLTHGLLADGVLPSNIDIMKSTDDGSEGYKGLATDLIVDYVDRADEIFACGPLPMYQAMAQMPELKNRPVQVSLEIMMGCGLGVCYGCTVKTKAGLKQVCKDGPVFELQEILWEDSVY